MLLSKTLDGMEYLCLAVASPSLLHTPSLFTEGQGGSMGNKEGLGTVQMLLIDT